MDGFLNRLRRIRARASEESERAEAERAAKEARARQTREQVESAADEVEKHIERRFAEFRAEFVEFLYESFTWEGRQFRVYFNEPIGEGGPKGIKPAKCLHQLSFHVRRYPDAADIEVVAKAIVRNRDRWRCSHQEDVLEGDPHRLCRFVDTEIVEFTRLYLSPERDGEVERA